ncbi:hypothetical protein DUNSADRAFT_3650, partial [Dunaliella salina]
MVGRPPGSAMKTYVAPGTAQRLGTASGLQDGPRNCTSDALTLHNRCNASMLLLSCITDMQTSCTHNAMLRFCCPSAGLHICRADTLSKERSANMLLLSCGTACLTCKPCAHQDLVRNKNYPQSGGLRVNLGNIYFEQQKFPLAIKNYRMALDQVPQTGKEVQFKIMRNIGLAFVHMGQYQDAHQTFTTVMQSVPDHQTGYNLVVCSFALGDREGMKQAFLRLLEVPPYEMEDDEDVDLLGLMGGEDDDMQNVVQNDGLREELRKRQNYITRCIVNSAQLISEKIEKAGYAAGYDWCAEQLRTAGYVRLANEVELAKASKFLGNKEFESAIAVFKEFEKKESRVRARAATNLAFLHMLEAHTGAAHMLKVRAEGAISRVVPKSGADTLKGHIEGAWLRCVLMALLTCVCCMPRLQGDYEGAKSLFLESLSIEPFCVEANFNMGLVNLRMDDPEVRVENTDAKARAKMPDCSFTLINMGLVDQKMDDPEVRVENTGLVNLRMDGPGKCCRECTMRILQAEPIDVLAVCVAGIARSAQGHKEAHRVYPVSMDVISWLGAFHVRNEVYEKAMPYFDLASKIQPQEVKWGLMVASCLRRVGLYPQALARYKIIDSQHPNNVECLKYLVHLCTELGRRDDAQAYMERLRKAEKAQ